MRRLPIAVNSRKVVVWCGRVAVVLLCLPLGGVARAENPLAPVDTSSPRATMASFLALTEEATRRYAAYRDSPSPATQETLLLLSHKTERLFDLSQVAPAAHRTVADETFYLLWEVVTRIELPDLADIPGASADEKAEEEAASRSGWRIPGTEITIARVKEGPRAGDFLFTPDTVSRAPRFYEAVHGLPYLRRMPIEDVYSIHRSLTGWMIPVAWIERLPGWSRAPVYGQDAWRWIALLLLSGLALAMIIVISRWSSRKPWDGSVGSFLRRLMSPLSIFVAAWLLWFLTTQQINVTGAVADLPVLLLEIAKGLAGVMGVWITARWLAGALVASPRQISLIRLTVRALGFLALLVIVFRTAHNLGIPVYGLIAGAGVGGLGVALAARSSLENFVGTINLYMDPPVKVGDFCRYGEDPSSAWLRIGTVEEIGLRSTRIRGIDRTITTIPNAEFSNTHIVNLTERERILFRTTLALRYETTPDQLRLVLVRLREMLVAHPRVTMAPSRVRAIGFGDYSLNLEIFAYVGTSDWEDFLAVQEDLVLRIMDIVREAGTAIAVPSRTLYHGRDARPDAVGREAAEKQVRDWKAAHELPFPDFSTAHRSQLRDTLDYPPRGSVAADRS